MDEAIPVPTSSDNTATAAASAVVLTQASHGMSLELFAAAGATGVMERKH